MFFASPALPKELLAIPPEWKLKVQVRGKFGIGMGEPVEEFPAPRISTQIKCRLFRRGTYSHKLPASSGTYCTLPSSREVEEGHGGSEELLFLFPGLLYLHPLLCLLLCPSLFPFCPNPNEAMIPRRAKYAASHSRLGSRLRKARLGARPRFFRSLECGR